MKEQHLFLGRPADRSEPLTAAALQALPSPATPLPRSLPVPRNSRAQPGGVWQPGCCTHPHLEWALRPLLQHAGDNSPELTESSAINRVFPVPPHAQCHYAALTLLSTLCTNSREEANPTGAVLMLLPSTALERRVGSAGNRRASRLWGPHPTRCHPISILSAELSGTFQWATAQLLCSSSTVPVTARPALSKQHSTQAAHSAWMLTWKPRTPDIPGPATEATSPLRDMTSLPRGSSGELHT